MSDWEGERVHVHLVKSLFAAGVKCHVLVLFACARLCGVFVCICSALASAAVQSTFTATVRR